jgi:hypothetical protein
VNTVRPYEGYPKDAAFEVELTQNGNTYQVVVVDGKAEEIFPYNGNFPEGNVGGHLGEDGKWTGPEKSDLKKERDERFPKLAAAAESAVTEHV